MNNSSIAALILTVSTIVTIASKWFRQIEGLNYYKKLPLKVTGKTLVLTDGAYSSLYLTSITRKYIKPLI